MRVLFVTKPLGPPWNDSAKILPRDLAQVGIEGCDVHVLVSRDKSVEWPESVQAHPVYQRRGSYRPSLGQHIRMMLGVWVIRNTFDVLHFFFQPHPRAVQAARLLARICGKPTVHTVLSAPQAPDSGLVFADRTIALSRATANLLEASGAKCAAVIPPGLADVEPSGRKRVGRVRREFGLERPFVLYPGDYEFSGGYTFLIDLWADHPWLPSLVLAGRAKTKGSVAAQESIKALARKRGLKDRVRFLGTVLDSAALIAACEALLFPAESLYGKSDLPLVILEAWRESRPVLTSDLPPLAEAVAVGGRVLPLEGDQWVAALDSLPENGARWGREGREHFVAHHTASVSSKAYSQVYDQWRRR